MRAKKQKKRAAGAVEAKVEVLIRAPQKRVWSALVNVAEHWWPKDFLSSAKAKRFVIEPKLGGRFYEDYGRGEGFVWYTVVGIESPNFLQATGFMAPPFGGPLTSLLRLGLSSVSPKETRLEVHEACFGFVEECDTADGWREIFEKNFRSYVEGGV